VDYRQLAIRSVLSLAEHVKLHSQKLSNLNEINIRMNALQQLGNYQARMERALLKNLLKALAKEDDYHIERLSNFLGAF